VFTPSVSQAGQSFTINFQASAAGLSSSIASITISVVTTDIPPVPTGLNAVPSRTSATEIDLNWNASAGATGYNIYVGSNLIPWATSTSTSYSLIGLYAGYP